MANNEEHTRDNEVEHHDEVQLAGSNMEDDDSDEEMRTLFSKLKNKFGGGNENEECFPSNPLRKDYQKYVEFTDDTVVNRIGTIDWCRCGKCVAMTTNTESICCQEVENAQEHMTDLLCITENEVFINFCEREAAVNLIMRTVGHCLHPPSPKEIHCQERKTAYRTFTAWIHGYLGVGNRRPIPSCVVKKVRDSFPDPDQQYTGFKFSNDNPAEFMAFE